jgi:murein L,D-transpeptidase YcbB/YkuD
LKCITISGPKKCIVQLSCCNHLIMTKPRFILVVLLLVRIAYCLPAGAATSEEFKAAMDRQLSCYPMQLLNPNEQEISILNEDLCLAAVYQTANLKPLWVNENGPGEKGAVILQYLANAETEGLRPADYNVAEIKSLWYASDPDDLARLDSQLTLNLVKYVHDVSHGRIIPFKTDPGLFAEAGDHHYKPAQVVQQALAAPDLASYLDSLPPAHQYYRNLREALQFYRNIARTGGWQKVSEGKTLRPGDQDERIVQVRQRLAKTGKYPVPAGNQLIYDTALVDLIREFQKKSGLTPDGIIGPKTLTALNVTPEEIITRIILNMARWRWEGHELGRRYIIVNIANYDLTAVEDGRVVLEMPVIVGKVQHQTPVFSQMAKYVDFNPFWNIPPSIASKEELPELRKDRSYLVNRKVRLFSSWQAGAHELDSVTMDWNTVTPKQMERYKLRQDPGPWNALGPVKLVFPNTYDVYIHGTPAQELFEHNVRNFSHGCIRASRPLELAGFVLSHEKGDWSMEHIQEIVARGRREVVNITSPLPVYITYQTVWIDKSGLINYRSDAYGRDSKLAEVLFPAAEKEAKTTRNHLVNN